MPSMLVIDRRRITPQAPTDLRWVHTPVLDAEVAEITEQAAARTVLTFAGESATTVLAALGLNVKEIA